MAYTDTGTMQLKTYKATKYGIKPIAPSDPVFGTSITYYGHTSTLNTSTNTYESVLEIKIPLGHKVVSCETVGENSGEVKVKIKLEPDLETAYTSPSNYYTTTNYKDTYSHWFKYMYNKNKVADSKYYPKKSPEMANLEARELNQLLDNNRKPKPKVYDKYAKNKVFTTTTTVTKPSSWTYTF